MKNLETIARRSLERVGKNFGPLGLQKKAACAVLQYPDLSYINTYPIYYFLKLTFTKPQVAIL